MPRITDVYEVFKMAMYQASMRPGRNAPDNRFSLRVSSRSTRKLQ